MFFRLLNTLNDIDDKKKESCRNYLDAKSSVKDYSVTYYSKYDFVLFLFYFFSLNVQEVYLKQKFGSGFGFLDQ